MNARIDLNINMLHDMRDSGLTLRQIATELGVNHDTVWRRLREDEAAGVNLPAVAVDMAQDIIDREAAVLGMARKGSTVVEIADAMECAPRRVRELLDAMTDAGHLITMVGDDVQLTAEPRTGGEHKIDVHAETDGVYRFGIVADSHLCSKYERLDVLEALYDEFARQGLDTVYHAGNYIDGECRFNRHDIHTAGMDNQLNYFLDQYPQRDGIATHYISGDCHEGWYRGVDVGAHLQRMARERGRTDLHYLGYMESDVTYCAPEGKTTLRLIHPGGGTAYALSYRMQKIVESLSGGEKPQVLVCGHFHKSEYIYLRGVHCIQAACTQDQTPFMRKKQNACHLGGWVIEMGVNERGSVTWFKQQFIPFYDKPYHERRWSFQRQGAEPLV